MDQVTRKPFSRRAFVALMAAVSGSALPLTGLAVHLLHGGPAGPGRHAWMAAHWGLGIIFSVFTVWHVSLNRRPFFKYARGLTGNLPALSRELLTALAVTGAIVLGLVLHAGLAH
jgi:hypothetical protein